MKHDDIIEWANADDNGLMVRYTTQRVGTIEDKEWPVTLITGPHPDPLDAVITLLSGGGSAVDCTREHEPVPGQRVLGYEHDLAIAVLVDADKDGETDPWLHIMLYEDADTFELGWASQTGS